MLDAIFGGMMLMYLLVGVYIGAILPVKRRALSIVFCATLWPIMLLDVKWKK